MGGYNNKSISIKNQFGKYLAEGIIRLRLFRIIVLLRLLLIRVSGLVKRDGYLYNLPLYMLSFGRNVTNIGPNRVVACFLGF